MYRKILIFQHFQSIANVGANSMYFTYICIKKFRCKCVESLGSILIIGISIQTLTLGRQAGTKIRSASFSGFALRDPCNETFGARCVSTSGGKYANGAFTEEDEFKGSCTLCTCCFTREICDQIHCHLDQVSNIISATENEAEKSVRIEKPLYAFMQAELKELQNNVTASNRLVIFENSADPRKFPFDYFTSDFN